MDGWRLFYFLHSVAFRRFGVGLLMGICCREACLGSEVLVER
jgi:hypothetical protein